jgi:translation initiation factor 2B subunit (eIF-2B alpha/beta/delta family)
MLESKLPLVGTDQMTCWSQAACALRVRVRILLLPQEKIAFAGDVLVRNAVVKVVDDDVVLTYAFSSIILNILLRAQQVTPRLAFSL